MRIGKATVCAIGLVAIAVASARAQTPPLDATDPSITAKPKLADNQPRMPEYPSGARSAGLEGEAKFKLCVDASGRVTSHELVASAGSDVLDRAAANWIKGARFTPAQAGGKAVSVCNYRIGHQWRLSPGEKTRDYRHAGAMGLNERPRLLTVPTEPEYPAKALAERKQGKVRLSVCISSLGKVEYVTILSKQVDDALVIATARWIADWEYAPGTSNGVPVGVCRVEIERNWKLPG